MASIVDRPKASTEGDLLEIEKYTNGLIQFIEHSATPITIGVQGEWGSGKTSLLNTIKEDLCDKDGAKHYPIWLNTWEYSLLSTPDETLIKIISGLVGQVGELTKNNKSENGKKAAKAIGSLLKGFGSGIGGVAGKAMQMTGDAIDSTLDKPQDNSIKALRIALQSVINEAIENSDKKAFIFFIDDLDRLDPTIAVSILELIKNLFDLNNCIFVLAIDYGVVVKGLQSKFGKMTEENEWEFRAFFDKIIQLPFSMPTSNYNIAKYLQSLLINVKYFEKSDLDNEQTVNNIAEMVGLSVGTNPRALKRLANSVALIEIIRGDEDKITAEERVIEFALICIQIAYPLIYGLIQKESDFTSWSNQFVYTILKNKKIDTNDLEILKETEEFDEEWEQNIWKICQVSTFLKQRSYQISKLLNFIKDNIPDNKSEDMSVTLDRLLSMSSVTSVSAENVAKSSKILFQFKLHNQKFIDKLAIDYQDFADAIQSEFILSSNNNGGSIYFRYSLVELEFNFVFWRDSKQISIGLDGLRDASRSTKEVARDWFKYHMKNDFASMKYSGKKRWGFLILYHHSFTEEEMNQGEEFINDIYQKKVLEIMDKLIVLKEFYLSSQKTVTSIKRLLDKIEQNLQQKLTPSDGWRIDMNNVKSLKKWQSLIISNENWGNGQYKIYLSSNGSYFSDPYIGVLTNNDFKNAAENKQNELYKKLEENFNSLGHTQESFFRAKIEIVSPIKTHMYKINELDGYAYDEDQENKAVQSIVSSIEKLASFKNEFTDLIVTDY